MDRDVLLACVTTPISLQRSLYTSSCSLGGWREEQRWDIGLQIYWEFVLRVWLSPGTAKPEATRSCPSIVRSLARLFLLSFLRRPSVFRFFPRKMLLYISIFLASLLVSQPACRLLTSRMILLSCMPCQCYPLGSFYNLWALKTVYRRLQTYLNIMGLCPSHLCVDDL